MKPLTSEWVEKAEADLASAQRELRARKPPNYDLARFLAQQGIEKYLKARLQEESIPFAKTHDLAPLLKQLSHVEPAWLVLLPALTLLSAYAVVFRYPGRSATRLEARDAIEHARKVRTRVRQSLGLPVGMSRKRVSRGRRKKQTGKTSQP